MQQSKWNISDARQVLNTLQAVLFFTFLLITLSVFEILDGREKLQEQAKPEFPGGSISLKSQLGWMEERRGISSYVFIHSNQESVEQELRLGSGGTLPH